MDILKVRDILTKEYTELSTKIDKRINVTEGLCRLKDKQEAIRIALSYLPIKKSMPFLNDNSSQK